MDFDKLEFIKPRSPELQRALLMASRKEYTQFYMLATAEDSKMMDALVLCRCTLKNGFNEPRDYMPPEFRFSFERVCNNTEQVFTMFRENVRKSPSFLNLNGSERVHIERTLFTIEVISR
jgi:hypothetical protein